MPSVMFYVQHLWGVGHVYRATRIAHGLRRYGFDVHLVWGGTQIPGFDFSGIRVHSLKPVRTSDVSFSQLLHADGSNFTDKDKAQRCDTLLALFDQVQPDILITEAFPFGRRQMQFELLPLLQKAKASKKVPMIAASIRDIMQENRKEKRVVETNQLVEQFFDVVLVHGDENLISIEDTLQGVETFKQKIHYTGLVTPELENTVTHDELGCDVLVTVGGGAFGQRLTKTAIEAMVFSKAYPTNWIVSAGTEMPEEDYQNLIANAPEGMRVVRYVMGLANAMKHTKVSVSHAGYNTVGDILKSGCACVLYPYTDGNESEQLRRAEMMHDAGVAIMLSPDQLTPKNFAKCVDKASALDLHKVPYKLDGADGTAQVLADAYKKHVSS